MSAIVNIMRAHYMPVSYEYTAVQKCLVDTYGMRDVFFLGFCYDTSIPIKTVGGTTFGKVKKDSLGYCVSDYGNVSGAYLSFGSCVEQ